MQKTRHTPEPLESLRLRTDCAESIVSPNDSIRSDNRAISLKIQTDHCTRLPASERVPSPWNKTAGNREYWQRKERSPGQLTVNSRQGRVEIPPWMLLSNHYKSYFRNFFAVAIDGQ